MDRGALVGYSPWGCRRVGHDFSSVQFSRVWLPMDWAHQASLSITNSQSLHKLMSIKSVMPSNHLILCCPLLLLPSILASIRVFSNESVLRVRWPKLEHQSFQWTFGWTDWISLQSKGLLRVFSNTTVLNSYCSSNSRYSRLSFLHVISPSLSCFLPKKTFSSYRLLPFLWKTVHSLFYVYSC